VGALSGAANVNYVWACGEAGILIDAAAGSVVIRNNVVGADPANNLVGACSSAIGACGGIAEVDVGPACSTNHVAGDGTGKVQVVIFGSAELDVIDIDPSTVRVRQATAVLTSIEDVDGDVVDDLLIQVDTSALGGLGSGAALHVFAAQDDSRVVLGDAPVTWVSTTTDADSDGVRDSCDLCPNQAAPAPDADGCP
jgi:hypothetical protein